MKKSPREHARAWLATAPAHEIISTLQEALNARADAQFQEDGVHTAQVGLAVVSRVGHEPWHYAMAASPAPHTFAEGSPYEAWCQFGRCVNCELELVSGAKTVLCPSCGALAHLT